MCPALVTARGARGTGLAQRSRVGHAADRRLDQTAETGEIRSVRASSLITKTRCVLAVQVPCLGARRKRLVAIQNSFCKKRMPRRDEKQTDLNPKT